MHREIDGARGVPEPVQRLAGPSERREGVSSWRLAGATLACPSCDAPVLVGLEPVSPRDQMSCAFCRHAAAVRDFLSLAQPTRPTRVAVWVRGLAVR
jgi:hypothetical protein